MTEEAKRGRGRPRLMDNLPKEDFPDPKSHALSDMMENTATGVLPAEIPAAANEVGQELSELLEKIKLFQRLRKEIKSELQKMAEGL